MWLYHKRFIQKVRPGPLQLLHSNSRIRDETNLLQSKICIPCSAVNNFAEYTPLRQAAYFYLTFDKGRPCGD